jgi:predicted GNAT family N-acyltransferase/very-short-patch-repair endonuclease
MKKHPIAGAHTRARTLRQNMTEAEMAVWGLMRSRQIDGYRFRRQVPLGPYIVDFACHAARLIIEIDGGQHDQSSTEETERNRFLEGQGYRILRFWNNDVLTNPEGVWVTISTELTENHPLPTLPHRGGGLSPPRPSLLPKTDEVLRGEWYRFDDFSAALLYEALRFRQAIFVVEQRCAYPDLDGLDQRAQHLLLRSDGTLAGYLRLIVFPDETRIAIGRVAIAAPWRGRGFARRLMEEALARCRQDYPDCTVTLSAQTYLVRFYETLGFRATSAPYDDYGVPHVDMVRSSST